MARFHAPLIALSLCAAALNPPARAEETVLHAEPIIVGDSGFSLKLPKEATVAYRGHVSHDTAGVGSANMLYPAPSLAGALVAVATHAFLVGAQKESQKTQMQEAADQVLTPYKETLDGFSNRELMERGLAQVTASKRKEILSADGHAESGWVIESQPVFTMTQDRSALILENAVSVYAADAPGSAVYRNVVKVVSDTRADAASPTATPAQATPSQAASQAASAASVPADTTPPAAVSADEAKRLKDESVALYAHSLNLLLSEIAKRAPEGERPQKTFRYLEGKNQRMERGALVREFCDRAVLMTLRGWLLSVPVSHPASQPAPAGDCQDPYRYPA